MKRQEIINDVVDMLDEYLHRIERAEFVDRTVSELAESGEFVGTADWMFLAGVLSGMVVCESGIESVDSAKSSVMRAKDEAEKLADGIHEVSGDDLGRFAHAMAERSVKELRKDVDDAKCDCPLCRHIRERKEG